MNSTIVASFLLLLSIAYLGFINSLNFPMNYKILLYLPTIMFFVLFLLLAMKNKSKSTSGEPEIGGFPY
jgi:ABC-type multidrug transport system permease subunit